MRPSASREPCYGCGAVVPRAEGPAHRYIGASPGCWAVFGEVTEREYGDFGYARLHGLAVDSYCVQHPGVPSPQAVRSVAVHLISLCLQLERALPPEKAYAVRQRAAALGKEGKAGLRWLDPPQSLGALTVLHVRETKTPEEHARRVREWATSTWEAWRNHHDEVRRWASLIRVCPSKRHPAERSCRRAPPGRWRS